MKVSLFGGSFDDKQGKASKVFAQFAYGVKKHFGAAYVTNGGHILQIPNPYINNYDLFKDDILFWMPNLSDYGNKVVEHIKYINPKIILIMSKAIYCRDIGLPEVIQKMLRVKANLCLVIDKKDNQFNCRLIDPLGNLFYEGEDFFSAGKVAAQRADKLSQFTRVESRMIYGTENAEEANPPEEFLSIIHKFAKRFDELTDRPKTVSRFLGNASFRCSHGFPAFRGKDRIFVSRRNVDKEDIGPPDFVGVEPFRPYMSGIEYYGNNKPSVDAPIQLLLFDHMLATNFIIHGHVYSKSFTAQTYDVIPCGAVEEWFELKKVLTPHLPIWSINIKGHGCIIGAENAKNLEQFLDHLKARPIPEPCPV